MPAALFTGAMAMLLIVQTKLVPPITLFPEHDFYRESSERYDDPDREDRLLGLDDQLLGRQNCAATECAASHSILCLPFLTSWMSFLCSAVTAGSILLNSRNDMSFLKPCFKIKSNKSDSCIVTNPSVCAEILC